MDDFETKTFVIESLNLEDTSLEDLMKQRETDFLDIDDLNVFYSYPYFSREKG